VAANLYSSSQEERKNAGSSVPIHNLKAAKAFHKIGHPLFVEQTGLFIDKLNGFPGGLTQVFWDTLEADRVSELFGVGDNTIRATARTIIAQLNGTLQAP
jgi:XTP/dITP diphosphohydrolase